MPYPYVLNGTKHGLIKAMLRMKKNGIEEGDIKKEKIHISRRIAIRIEGNAALTLPGSQSIWPVRPNAHKDIHLCDS